MVTADMRTNPGLTTGPQISGISVCSHPEEREATISISDGRILKIRPARPEDMEALRTLFAELSGNEIRQRFLHAMYRVPDAQLAEFTRMDPDSEVSFVLAGSELSNKWEIFGTVQLILDQDKKRAEFAILVRSDLAGMGVGKALMEHIIAYARSQSIKEIYGEALFDNKAMLGLATALHFSFAESGDPESVIMSLPL
jgi:acetyltransferase